MSNWSRGAILSCVFALSCGGARAQVKPSGETSHEPVVDDDVAPPRESKASELEKPTTSSEAQRRADESARPDESINGSEKPLPREARLESLVLKLPANPAFLQARLPEKRPERYKAWRQQKRIWVGHSHLQHASFLAGESKLLVKSDAEGAARIYDRRSGKLLQSLALGGKRYWGPDVLSWPDHEFQPLPGASDPGDFVRLGKEGIDLFDGKTTALRGKILDHGVFQASFSSDRSLFIAQSGARQGPSVLDFYARPSYRELKHLGTLRFSERVDDFALSRDNRLLALTYYKPQELHVIDLHTGRDILRLPSQDYVASIDFSPDGRWIAIGGQGLLLIDLLNASRRAYYSHYYNNINTVRFSPSGDALATSSYDGHIRIFRYGGLEPSLTLLRALRHDGRANVYRIQFSADGNTLLSSSGDQTVRLWGAQLAPTSRSPEQDEFRTLAAWAELTSDAEKNARPAPEASMRFGHYYPPALDEKPRPSKIREGIYSCKVSQEYKLRECIVKKRNGHFMLEFGPDNLLDLRGVLYDDGNVVRYEAWLAKPSTIVGCDGCERQALHGVFRGHGKSFQGVLTFRNYYDPLRPPPLPPKNIKFEGADDRFPLTLLFKKPLPPPKQGHESFDFPPVN